MKSLRRCSRNELTHIRNADVRLLIIAVIFAGIFSFVGEMAFRSLRFGGVGGGGSSRRSGGSSRDSGRGAVIAIIVALVIIGVAYALAIVIRFALSRRARISGRRRRGELTKNRTQ